MILFVPAETQYRYILSFARCACRAAHAGNNVCFSVQLFNYVLCSRQYGGARSSREERCHHHATTTARLRWAIGSLYSAARAPLRMQLRPQVFVLLSQTVSFFGFVLDAAPVSPSRSHGSVTKRMDRIRHLFDTLSSFEATSDSIGISHRFKDTS